MFESGRMQDDIHAAHARFQAFKVADIAKKEVDVIVIYEGLLEEKQLAFVIVNSDDFCCVCILEQIEQLLSDRTADAGNQNTFVFPSVAQQRQSPFDGFE